MEEFEGWKVYLATSTVHNQQVTSSTFFRNIVKRL